MAGTLECVEMQTILPSNMDSHKSQHLCRYRKRNHSDLDRRAAVLTKKCKIITFLLAIILLFIVINIQTILYIIQEFVIGRTKLRNHFSVEDSSKRNDTMPRIIHQIHLGKTEFGKESEELYHLCQRSWKEKNNDYKYILWNTTMVEALMMRYPSVLPIYQRFRGNTKAKETIASYIVIHNMGGVYVDIDIMCNEDMDKLRSIMGDRTVMLSYTERSFGISTKLFMANKDHEFIAHVLDGLKNADIFYATSFVKGTLSTGPLFLLGRYLNYPHKDEVYLLTSNSKYIERVIIRPSWFSINGPFIFDPVQVISVILMLVCILRLLPLIKTRRNLLPHAI